MKRPLVCLLAVLLAGPALDAPVSGQSTAFEVVSIKPAPLDKKELQRHMGTRIDSAMADFGGVTLMMLITRAYGLNSFQVSGAPELNTTRFNILAKLPAGSSTAQVPEMLKTLLRERFRLEAHQDTRDFGVYSLTVAKGGPKIPLKPADYDPAYARSLEEKINNGTAHGVLPLTLARLADFINQYRDYLRLDRPVVDQSGLKSEYLIDREAFMLPSQAAAMAAQKDGADPTAAESALFSAAEKLGLRLEPRKVPMTALVIDHIEMTPTPQ
jgi:uncharacterized protein (TIGR03435 family)